MFYSTKMKELHLLYNPNTKEYYFSNASNPYTNGDRQPLKEENLLKSLKLKVDSKRKSLLNLINVNEEIEKEIFNLFEDSKIIIKRKFDKI